MFRQFARRGFSQFARPTARVSGGYAFGAATATATLIFGATATHLDRSLKARFEEIKAEGGDGGAEEAAEEEKTAPEPAAAAAPAAEPAAHGPGLNIIIAGAPGAGKGTQCEKIVEQYGLVHLSTGDIIRANIKSGSDLGKEFLSYTKAGKLVPDELVLKLVADAVASNPETKTKGWLLDGFPRTAAQAKAMPAMGLVPDLYLLIEVPDSVLEERICNRRTDPETGIIYNLKFKPPPAEIVPRLQQRKDDTKEALVTRLQEFHANVDAVSNFYTDITAVVDGTLKSASVTEGVIESCNDAIKAKEAH